MISADLIRSSDTTDSRQQIESSIFWNALVAMDGQAMSSIHLSIDLPPAGPASRFLLD